MANRANRSKPCNEDVEGSSNPTCASELQAGSQTTNCPPGGACTWRAKFGHEVMAPQLPIHCLHLSNSKQVASHCQLPTKAKYSDGPLFVQHREQASNLVFLEPQSANTRTKTAPILYSDTNILESQESSACRTRRARWRITLPSLGFSVASQGADDDNVTRFGNCYIDSESLR